MISLLRVNTSALERLLNQYSLQFVFQSIFPVIFTSVKVQQGYDKEDLRINIIGLLQNFVEKKKSDKQIVTQTLLIFIKKMGSITDCVGNHFTAKYNSVRVFGEY